MTSHDMRVEKARQEAETFLLRTKHYVAHRDGNPDSHIEYFGCLCRVSIDRASMDLMKALVKVMQL